jgi:hypothetical protein
VVKQSSLIQYQIQLFLCGFHDDFTGRSAASIAMRRDQLRTYWSRWDRLEPAEKTVVKLSGVLGANEFVGGVFSTVVGDKRTSLHFIRLPSVSRGIKQEEWTLDKLEMSIDGYTTDPSADVLIVYEDQRVINSRYVTPLEAQESPRLVEFLALLEYAYTSSAHRMGRSTQRRPFRLSITQGPESPSSTYLSADRRCACVSGTNTLTILLSGIGRPVNWYMWVFLPEQLRRVDLEMFIELP